MPHFDWSVSLGNILTVAGFISAAWLAGTRVYNGMDRRVLAFEGLLKVHAATLIEHASRMKTQDEMLVKLVGDVQRLIGRMEGSQQSTLDRAETVARGLIDQAAAAARVTVEAASQHARETLLSAAELKSAKPRG